MGILKQRGTGAHRPLLPGLNWYFTVLLVIIFVLKEQPWRAINIETTAKYGASYLTGNSGSCSLSAQSCPSVGYETQRKSGKLKLRLLSSRTCKFIFFEFIKNVATVHAYWQAKI